MPREGAFQLVEAWVLPPRVYMKQRCELLTATWDALQEQQCEVIQDTWRCTLQSLLTPGSPPCSCATDRHFKTSAKGKSSLGSAGRMIAPELSGREA